MTYHGNLVKYGRTGKATQLLKYTPFDEVFVENKVTVKSKASGLYKSISFSKNLYILMSELLKRCSHKVVGVIMISAKKRGAHSERRSLGLSWTVKILSLLGTLFVLQAVGGSSSLEEGEGATVALRWGEELLDNQDDALYYKARGSSKIGHLYGSEDGGGAGPEVAGGQVKYIFDWGDGTVCETGFVDPGTVVSLSHIWDSPGIYSVMVRAEDIYGASSEWSEPLEVTIVQRVNRFVGLRRR